MNDLRAYIKEKGGTIAGLAKHLGVSTQTVHYHLNRGSEMSLSEIERIVEYVGGDVSELFKKNDFVALVSYKGDSYRFDSFKDLKRKVDEWDRYEERKHSDSK